MDVVRHIVGECRQDGAYTCTVVALALWAVFEIALLFSESLDRWLGL